MNDLFYLGIKAVIKNPDGQVLLLKARDYWDLPGGRIQLGETQEQAVRREVTEETGLSVKDVSHHLGMCLSGARLDGGKAGLIFSVYACETASHDVAISDEHIAHEWLAPSKAADLLAGKFSPEICAAIANL